MNRIDQIRAWWAETRERRDQRQQAADRLTRDGLGWLHPPNTGEQPAIGDNLMQPTDDDLRAIRPTDTLGRRINPDRVRARDHTPPNRPGHRLPGEEVTVDE